MHGSSEQSGIFWNAIAQENCWSSTQKKCLFYYGLPPKRLAKVHAMEFHQSQCTHEEHWKGSLHWLLGRTYFWVELQQFSCAMALQKIPDWWTHANTQADVPNTLSSSFVIGKYSEKDDMSINSLFHLVILSWWSWSNKHMCMLSLPDRGSKYEGWKITWIHHTWWGLQLLIHLEVLG